MILTMALARRVAVQLGGDGRLADLVALAGLYHDIGHVSTCHLLDDMVVSMGSFPDHETRSSNTLKKVNDRVRYLDTETCLDVMGMITGTVPEGTLLPPWAFAIVHNRSGDPDVDRIAYLMSDGYHLGIPTIDASYLLSTIELEGERLVFGTKGRSVLEQTYIVRQRMFDTVYRHKTLLKFESALLPLLKSCIDVDAWFGSWAWLDLTDSKLNTMLRERYPVDMRRLDERSFSKTATVEALHVQATFDREDPSVGTCSNDC
jgi:HD superfamily phosphohydrolase